MRNVGQEAGVAEDLKFLADFIADVMIVGMEFCEFRSEGVDVFVAKNERLQGKCERLPHVRGGTLARHAGGPRGKREASWGSAASLWGALFRGQAVNDVQDVEGPAALGDGDFLEWFDFAELFADFLRGRYNGV